jgi:hypothetical protein
MADKNKIAEIVGKIFTLDSPRVDESRKRQIADFLETTINGDEINEYLAINVMFGKDRAGAGVYVLTNVRLIRINIEPNAIKSSDIFLNKMTMEWKITDGSQTEIKVSSGGDFFNLVYADDAITAFFKQVDQARVSAETRNG